MISDVPGRKAFTTHIDIKRLLDRATALKCAAARQPPMPGWAFHDFRRARVTALAEADFSPHAADMLLNHIQGTIRSVAAAYQRSGFAEERRGALDACVSNVVRHGQGKAPAGNVVRLAERAA